MPNKFIEHLQLKYCDKSVCGYEVANCPILEIVDKVNRKKARPEDYMTWCPLCNAEIFRMIKTKQGKTTVMKPDGAGGIVEDIGRDGRTRGMLILYACTCPMGHLYRDAGFTEYMFADEAPFCFRQRQLKVLTFKSNFVKERQALFNRATKIVEDLHETVIQE